MHDQRIRPRLTGHPAGARTEATLPARSTEMPSARAAESDPAPVEMHLPSSVLPPVVDSTPARASAVWRPGELQLATGQPAAVTVALATRADVPGIVRIHSQHTLHRKLDAAEHPDAGKSGWLVQQIDEETVREAMTSYKSLFVARDVAGRPIAYQAICHPRFISRPPEKHRFFGPFADAARDALRRGEYVYMSQIASDQAAQGTGVVKTLQRTVMQWLRPELPLFAHVAAFTQLDFDAWNGDIHTFQPRLSNVASLRYHHKMGYVPVAWTSDLARTERYNSGLEPPQGGTLPGICGVLLMRTDETAASVADAPYADPVRAILDSPISPHERNTAPWKNPFLPAAEDMAYDMDAPDTGFIPNVVLFRRYFAEKWQGQLSTLFLPEFRGRLLSGA